MTVAQRQFIIMLAAAFADRKLAVEEDVEIRAIMARARSTQELSEEARARLWDEAMAERKAGRWSAYVDQAITYFPTDPLMAHSIYAHCADIAYADRTLKASEMRFLRRLAKQLAIPSADRARINAVMEAKNRH